MRVIHQFVQRSSVWFAAIEAFGRVASVPVSRCQTGSVHATWTKAGGDACGKLDPAHLISVSDSAISRAPRRLRRVPLAMRAGARLGNGDRGAPQTGEIFLSQISARAIEAVCLLMVASLDFETLMSVVP